MENPGNPDALSDALVTIRSVTVSDKIQLEQQDDPAIVQHLFWSTGGKGEGFSIIAFAGEFKNDNDCNKNQLIMVLATAQGALLWGLPLVVAMCKYSLHTGQIMIQYVHSFVSVSKNSDCLSVFASTHISNSLIYLTLFR